MKNKKFTNVTIIAWVKMTYCCLFISDFLFLQPLHQKSVFCLRKLFFDIFTPFLAIIWRICGPEALGKLIFFKNTPFLTQFLRLSLSKSWPEIFWHFKIKANPTKSKPSWMLAFRIQQFDRLFKILSVKTLSNYFVWCDDHWHKFNVWSNLIDKSYESF